MSEAEAIIDPDEATLAELAAQDMALARHVNAQALATTDPETLNGLVRSAQRLARSIRQSIAAKARLKGDRAEEARRAAILAPPRRDPSPHVGVLSDQADLEVAALSRIRAEYDPSEAELLEGDLAEVIDEVWTDRFAALPLADQVEGLLGHIRDNYFEDAEADEDAPEDAGDDAPDEADDAAADPAPAPEPAAAEPEPEPEPQPPPEADPQSERPPDPPPEPPPKPYIPPSEINPYARYPGGSGW